MVDRDGRVRKVCLVLLLCVGALLRVEESFAADPAAPAIAFFTVDPLVAGAVERAAGKLSSASCRQVFGDFRDARGHTLQENLDALGQDGAGYLHWTLFYDGSGKPICASKDILAATAPGSRAVFVCRTQFAVVEHRDPGLAAALIIHEELHSLGLRENPPTSRQITAQVIARCGK